MDLRDGTLGSRSRVRFAPDGRVEGEDLISVEEPLLIRIHQEDVAVVMRTPGRDVPLAAGFLLAERLVDGPGDLVSIVPCPPAPPAGAAGPAGPDPVGDGPPPPPLPGDPANILEITLSTGGSPPLERRLFASGSSCGICGRRSIAELLEGEEPVPVDWTVTGAVLGGLPGPFREHQEGFALSGGLHGAALFDPSGRLMAIEEDVGRHSAVDKVVGAAMLAGPWPLERRLLMVSGRVSFEIVQKCWRARLPILVAVSAPTSLAVDLAHRAGLTLVAFCREGRFTVYTHQGRVA